MTVQDWTRLAAIVDDDEKTISAVTAAAQDHADPWTALIDGLDDAGALAYLNDEDTGIELADALVGLPRVFRTGADLEPVADVVGDLEAAIVVADGILAPYGWRIVYVEDEDPEAFPLVVVATDAAPEVVSAAGRLGHVARVFD